MHTIVTNSHHWGLHLLKSTSELKKTFLVLLLLSCIVANQTHAQETVGQAMEQFPISHKQADKLTEKLRKLNSNLSEKLTEYQREMLAQPEQLLDQDSLLLNAPTDTLSVPSQLDSLAESVGADSLVQVPSQSELLQKGIDSIRNNMEFLLGQEEAIKLNKSLGELNQELEILKSQEVLIEQLKESLKPEQLQALGKEFEELQEMVSEYKGLLSEYKDQLKNWGQELEKFIMENEQVKVLRKEYQESKLIESAFRDRSKSMQNLQTKEIVKEAIQESVGGTEEELGQMITEKIASANQLMSKKKQRLAELADIPGINKKANNPLKGVSLKHRLIFGGSVNINRGAPASADMNVHIAYRLTKRWSAGAGVLYRLNLGSAIDNLHLHGLGGGYRNFVDFGISTSWFLEAAYEGYWGNKYGNHQNAPRLENGSDNFFQTGLLGLGYKYRLSARLKGKTTLYYDLFNKSDSPYPNALMFRVGFEL
ncbi:hypothetical protein [uncultured Roseivirga sp.]|uniref:hypothetical protein n=1 Tax=uncultured Roseivirga sp. TaxID=543088 RepID=UPI000D7900D3|nr:hypothetical protein [uncultured Roseivirga sp.]PWL30060.1 MAG: hypothetical protein DCO95_09510 [Roseivirga sp. XM-24bin3]